MIDSRIFEKPKIFITPWIDLTAEDIDKCIKAGAYSARIHTGKTNVAKNIELIKYYNSRKFKFYLDIRGNKPSVDKIDEGTEMELVKLGEKVWIYEDPKYKNYGVFDHYLRLSFFPVGLRELYKEKGTIALDDGLVLFSIKRIIRKDGKVTGFETAVSKAKPVWYGDGVSSTDLFIHSGTMGPFSAVDMKILKKIPHSLRTQIYFIAISFCESSENIIEAERILKNMGFLNAQVVPKIETMNGVKNIKQICKHLSLTYGPRAEIQIGRSDLMLDCGRAKRYVDPNKLTDIALKTCKLFGIKVSILSLLMHSVRIRHKADPESNDWEPSATELEYIKHICSSDVYQIGLTNDMYIDRPEEMIEKLQEVVNSVNL
jgi:pyruvate kinase